MKPKIYTATPDDLSPPVQSESFCVDVVLAADYHELEEKCQQLAAENVALKRAAEFATASDMWEDLGGDVYRYQYVDWYVDELRTAIETPATDRIVAGIKADGVEAFIGRLQQCVDDGDFVGDEVALIVGAIDCGKEFCEQLREGAK